jgi:predicted nucleotidyltransferase
MVRVFLTHNWAFDQAKRSNHERVKRVAIGLRAHGIDPWFDEERMRGDVNDQMAVGIDESDVVIVFITLEYIKKASGRGPNGMNDNW